MTGWRRLELDGGREWARAATHLLALAGFAAQPLFELLAAQPPFLVAHAAQPGDILLLVALWSLGPALLFLALAGIGRIAGRRVAGAILALAVAVLLAWVLLAAFVRLAPARAWPCIGAAGALAALGAWLWVRAGRRHVPASFAALAALGFPAHLLVFSPVAALLKDPEAEVQAARAERTATPVVLLVLDELPVTALMDAAGGIDAVRFPHFGAVARESTWFRNASAASDHTTFAVPAIATGAYPRRYGPPIAGEYPRNLFTLLVASHRLRVVEPITRLCPAELCREGDGRSARRRRLELANDSALLVLHTVLPDRFRTGLPPVHQGWRFGAWGRAGGRLVHTLRGGRLEDVERFLELLEGPAGPALDFAHFSLPHAPYELLPSGRAYEPAAPMPGKPGPSARTLRGRDLWSPHEVPVREAHRMYLLQLGAVDRMLGRVLERLRAGGLYDRCLLIVTADHGANFEPGEHHRIAEASNVAEIAAVPLFVKLPEQRQGRVDDRLAATIDIAPTIAEVIGARPGWEMDGRSLLQRSGQTPRDRWLQRPEGTGAGATLARFRVPATPPQAGRALRRGLARFGSGTPLDALHRTGPWGELVGRSVAELAVGGFARFGLAIDRPGPRVAVPAAPARLPALVQGRAWGRGAAAGARVAIAVDGTVHAVTALYATPRGLRFTTLLPEEALPLGSRELRAFVVERAGAGPVLRRPLPRLGAAPRPPPPA